MRRERKLDQFLSVIVLLLYAVVITIKWIMAYQSVPDGAIMAVNIIGTIIQCLVILVVLYNALGFTGNWILKIVFIAIALFLIATSIAGQFPVVRDAFIGHNIPLIF